MLRGEKRALPVDGPPGPGGGGSASGAGSATSNGIAASGTSNGQSPHKKPAKEKMPDFDWAADNYALTWRLVDELRKPENKSVLFPDHDNLTAKVRLFRLSPIPCSWMDWAWGTRDGTWP